METLVRSWFFRLWASALVLAVGYLGFAISSHAPHTGLPVAEAGGVFGHARPGYIYTTNDAGNVLYVWPILGQAPTSHLERWSFEDGTVTYKPLTAFTPLAPGQGGVPVPFPPGGFVPGQPLVPGQQPLPPAPRPGDGR